jgi:hypothetical protein
MSVTYQNPRRTSDDYKSSDKLASMIGDNGGFLLTDGADVSIELKKTNGTQSLSHTRVGRTFVFELAASGNVISTTAALLLAYIQASVPELLLLGTPAVTATGLMAVDAAQTLLTGTAVFTAGAGEVTFTRVETAAGPFRAICAVSGNAEISTARLTAEWGGHAALAGHIITNGVSVTMGIESITRTSGIIACYY